MKVGPFTKQQAKYIANDLRRDYLCESFPRYDGSLQVIFGVCIAPYPVNKRHELLNLYLKYLNAGAVTRRDIDHYIDNCPETEYTVVAVVGNPDTHFITPYLYPLQQLATNELKVFAFNFLNA